MKINRKIRSLQIANILAFVLMIIVNYVSNIGAFNGNTMKTISDAYFNYFTPAPYAFSIWGLIYLGLLGFVIYSSRSLFKKNVENQIVLKIGWWFVISSLGNALWVVTFLSDYIGLSVIIMLVVFLSLLKIVLNTRMELDFHPLKKYVFIYWPFAIYFGWISVALLANVAAWLTKINWDGWGISEVNWAIIMVCVTGLINLVVIWSRNLREFAAVGVWALIAIGISNKSDGAEVIVYTTYTVAAVVFIFIVISGIKNRSKSFDKL